MISGFIAVISAARGDVLMASWLIVAAMIFDFLDGLSARLLKAYSELGKELDSLADAVSFGVAPAVIIFDLLNNTVSTDYFLIRERVLHSVLMFVPAIMPVCAALRLAVFNTDPAQSRSFKGLPTPASAMAVIMLVFAANFSDSSFVKSFIDSPLLLLSYTIILSLLMVSRIHLLSLKIRSFGIKGNEGIYILPAMILVAWLLIGAASLLLIIPLYVLSSLIHYGLFNKNAE